MLGPSSSRLMRVNSVFLKQIEVTGDSNSEVLVYGFNEKPELSLQANWSASNFLVVPAYSRQVTHSNVCFGYILEEIVLFIRRIASEDTEFSSPGIFLVVKQGLRHPNEVGSTAQNFKSARRGRD